MGKSQLVECVESLFNFSVDPGFFSSLGGGSAGSNDIGKGRIRCHLKPVGTDRLVQ